MNTKDFLSIRDLDDRSLEEVFTRTDELKKPKEGKEDYHPLKGKSVALIFEKPSLRTRVSFEVAIGKLGGESLYLAPGDIQLGKREKTEDLARVIARYVDCVVARTFSHQVLEELAGAASIPVINALSDLLHTCQVLAYIQPVREKKGETAGLKVTWMGDGNNVCHSWINAAPRVGMHLVIATPPGYEPREDIVANGKKEARARGTSLELEKDPSRAVRDADVIYTDVWASMGKEAEKKQREKVFRPYQVNEELVAKAKSDCLVMHCLPAHRGEEITDAVVDGPHSVVIDEAENRLHTARALLDLLLSPGKR